MRLLALSLQVEDTGAFSLRHYEQRWAPRSISGCWDHLHHLAADDLGALLLGYPLARWLARLPDARRGWLVMLVMIPFWTSYLVKTFAWMITLDRTA